VPVHALSLGSRSLLASGPTPSLIPATSAPEVPQDSQWPGTGTCGHVDDINSAGLMSLRLSTPSRSSGAPSPFRPAARVWHQCSRAAIAPLHLPAGRPRAATDRTETTFRVCVSRAQASGQKTPRVGRSSRSDSGPPSVSAGSPHRRSVSPPPQRCSAMLRSITLRPADPAYLLTQVPSD
jgi:hypothetical protein